MKDKTLRLATFAALALGSALGMAGTFISSASVRGVLWGLDGILLVVAAALLSVHHCRKGNDVVAAGFLVYLAGQTLVIACAAMDLAGGAPVFGAGAGLWAAALLLLSTARVAPVWVRLSGVVAGVAFLAVAIQLFMGQPLTPLSEPLPFFAYPLLVATLMGWGWQRLRADP